MILPEVLVTGARELEQPLPTARPASEPSKKTGGPPPGPRMVTDDNIDIVAAMDLLAEYSDEVRQEKLAEIDAEVENNQALVRAWLAPRPKNVMTQ